MTDDTNTVAPEQPDAEPAPKSEPRFITDRVRSKFIALEWPVEFDGKVYHQIRVHRVTGREMTTFMEKIREGADDVLPPMVDCPLEVWNALDADDQFAIDQAATEFMPRRLKDLQSAVATLDTGN